MLFLQKPQKIRSSINKKSRIKPSSRYFNETFNDRWIIEYVFPGKRNGYFLEAGAANGRIASSCYLLERKLGWNGICIEPHPAFVDLIPQNRPKSIHEAVCLSDRHETVSFVIAEGEIGPYFSGIKQNLEEYKWEGEKIVEKGQQIELPAVPLVEILRKHHAPKVIDYAALDIEGSELKVIESFPWNEYQFSALSVEADDWAWKIMLKQLERHGYREVHNPFCDKEWEKYCVHETIWDDSFMAR